MATTRLNLSDQLETAAEGSLITYNASSEQSILAPGTDGHVLTLASGNPVWQAPDTLTGVVNQIPYFNSTSTITTEAGSAANALTWDPTNNFLGIQQTTPKSILHVGTATTSGTVGANAVILGAPHASDNVGDYALLSGLDSHASGTRSFAHGLSATASGTTSVSIGTSTTASGQNSSAFNSLSEASGANSHAEGNNTTASGTDSHAEGQATVASGTRSHAQNINTTAQGYGQTAIGSYNVAEGSNTQTNNAASAKSDAGFIMGNGDSATSSNAYSITWDGVHKMAPTSFSRTTDPSSPAAGWMYYNTSTNKLRLYDGTVWVDLN